MADGGYEANRASSYGRTRIALCGSLVVEIEGRRLEDALPGRQGRVLFAYLAANRSRPVSRDKLIDALWPRQAPAAPEAALSTLLARLRRVVGERVIEGRGELRLRLQPDAWVDLEVAAEGARRAESALEAGDLRQAIDTAGEALGIVSQPLLPSLEGDWIDERRRELEALAPSLLEVVARAGIELGGPDARAAERAARSLIEGEPYRESGYALLMEAYARQGNVAEALRTYDRLRVLLRDELGTTPAASVTALNERLLLEGEPPGGGEAPGDAARRGGARGGLAGTPADVRDAPPDGPVPLPPQLARSEERAFVGRTPELEHLRSRWAEATAAGPRLMLLAGEPGIGKTRLAARLAGEVHAAHGTVLYGHADEESVIPYQPLVEALRHYFAHCAAADLEGDLEAELGRLVPELRGDAGLLPAPLAGDPDAQRYRLFEGVAAVLSRLARVRPLLLVVDDLQWADRPTLLLLRHLLRYCDGAPLAVLAAYRDVDPAESRPVEFVAETWREEFFDRVSLGGLDESETRALVADREDADLGSGFARELRARTDGNPLFVEETLRSLSESAALTEAGASEEALARMGVPEGVREVIGRRLARLDELAARLLGVASAMGREFRLEVLEAVLPEPSERLIAALEDTVAAGLVVELADGVDRFAFTHALVREALYDRQVSSRRLRLHRQIGEALERMGPAAAHPGELARHFFAARHVGGAAKAVDYSVRAGERAAQALAYEEAVGHYERALEALALDDADESRRCDILLALGRVQWQAGDRRGRESFSQAAEIARRLDAPERLARAALGFGGRYWVGGVYDTAQRRLLEEALEALGREDSSLRVRLLARLAGVLHLADPSRADAASREAVEAARRLEDPHALVAALTGRHFALLHIAHLDERLRVSAELLALAERIGHGELAAQGHYWRLYDLIELGDVESARREHAALAELAGRLRQPLYGHFAAAWGAVLAQLEGRFDEAERLAEESFELARRAQARDASSVLAGHLFTIRRDQGRMAELLSTVERMAEEFPALATWRAALPLARLEAGDEEGARAGFDNLASDDFAAVPRDYFWLGAMASLSEACAGLGDRPRAEALYRELLPYAERNVQVGLAVCWGSVERFLALLAMAMTRWDLAERHFDGALERNAALGARPATARTEAGYADMLLARDQPGDRERAGALLERAYETAREIGMAALLEGKGSRGELSAQPL